MLPYASMLSTVPVGSPEGRATELICESAELIETTRMQDSKSRYAESVFLTVRMNLVAEGTARVTSFSRVALL